MSNEDFFAKEQRIFVVSQIVVMSLAFIASVSVLANFQMQPVADLADLISRYWPKMASDYRVVAIGDNTRANAYVVVCFLAFIVTIIANALTIAVYFRLGLVGKRPRFVSVQGFLALVFSVAFTIYFGIFDTSLARESLGRYSGEAKLVFQTNFCIFLIPWGILATGFSVVRLLLVIKSRVLVESGD